ncbi:LA_2490 family SGNH/GDSL-type esterase [Leptospira idonii]|uniref:Lipase n=1 Tax=Leptospira idonii TaxID=1193500 RepID=A0A4R9LWH4_9LEPT|nr:lipase [Leptospira idonii]TGN17694.1 lipase [Leptospira idonii]
MKLHLQRIGIYIALGLLILVFSEITLRLLNPPALQYYRDVKLLHSYHPDYGVTLEANESRYVRHYADLWEGRFTTNSLGLRGKKEPNQNAPKLLCLGDSMVMGFGVSDEDTFCSLLDGFRLGENTYQSLNLGVDAYGSLGSMKRLKDLSGKLTNIKEVLFFISPNDFSMPQVLRDQGILPDDELDSLHENDEEWKRNFRIQFEATRLSFLLQAMKLGLEQTKILLTQTKLSSSAEFHSAISNPYRYVMDSFYRTPKQPDCSKKTNAGPVCPEPVPIQEFTCIDKAPSSDLLPPLSDVTIHAYEEMITLSQKHGFKLRPVIIPMQIEELFCHVNGKYHPLGNYAIRAEAYWKTKGIPVIKLMPYISRMCGQPFVKKGKNKTAGIKDYFIPGDGHLTVIGNKWVADAVKQELEKEFR